MGHPAEMTDHLVGVLNSVSEIEVVHWQVQRKALIDKKEKYLYPSVVWSRSGIEIADSWGGGIVNLLFSLDFYGRNEKMLNAAIYAAYDALYSDVRINIISGLEDDILPEGNVFYTDLVVSVT